MEMPEGWVNLKLVFDGDQLFYGTDVEKALDLMKEMAEALEKSCKKAEHVWLLSDPPISKECVACEMLKKFKEWK